MTTKRKRNDERARAMFASVLTQLLEVEFTGVRLGMPTGAVLDVPDEIVNSIWQGCVNDLLCSALDGKLDIRDGSVPPDDIHPSWFKQTGAPQ